MDVMISASVLELFAFAPKLGVAPGSLRSSAPATLSGLTSSPQTIARIAGTVGQFCVAAAANCDCTVRAFANAATTIGNGQSVCVRQYAPPNAQASTTTTVLVGGGSATFFVSTASCSLDIGNGATDVLSDSLMVLRAMFGLTGTSVTNAAVGADATRGT